MVSDQQPVPGVWDAERCVGHQCQTLPKQDRAHSWGSVKEGKEGTA